MRLTRTALATAGVIAIVLVGVLAVAVGPASAPPAPTAMSEPLVGGPLFGDLAAGTISSLAIEELSTGDTILYQRNDTGLWLLAGDSSGYVIDSAALESNASAFINLMAYDRFTSDSLATYGLEAPAYLVTVQMNDGSSAELYVGGLNAAADRRYVVTALHTATAADTTAEATPSLDSFILTGEQAVATVDATIIDGWITMLTAPIFVLTPMPTATPAMEATAAVTSEP